MNLTQRLLGFAKPYRSRMSAAILAMAIYGGASAGLAYLIKPIFDEVLPKGESFGIVIFTLIGCYLLKGVGAYVSTYLMTGVGQRVVMDIRNTLFGHIVRQSVAFFSSRTTGRLMSRITNDVHQVQQAVSVTLVDLLRESLALVAYASLLFYYDVRLALVCMTGAPLVIYPLVRLGQRVRRTTKRSQEELERLSHVTAEAFTGHRIVKAFGAETFEEDKFRAASSEVYRTNMKVTGAVAALPPLMEFLGGIGIAGALWYGSREIATDRLTSGEFTSFMGALILMYGPVKKLSRVNAGIQQAIASAQRIFETMDVETEVRNRPHAKPLGRLQENITFQNVGFQYETDLNKWILRDINLTVRSGEIVAIVGLSGAGKTTLAHLLPRFHDVSNGAIFFDGVDIRDGTLTSLRSQIAMVTQETILFDDTIARNISYGVPNATTAWVEAAARAAHAHEFISQLDQGYETRIGERGQRLSGGQRQRIAIARAVLTDAPILILDEATSSLDSESEALVQDALSHLLANRTAFVIAHRLSTVRRADQILVLDQGKIVEQGRHEELLTQPGSVYAKLYATQLVDEESDSESLSDSGEQYFDFDKE
ncbi:MAG: ABC transporter ATP-binding protein [Acidobacteriota bacterium]|nr:ABC transporter ATP-binding protein [Acidobacteriota bacterium]